MPSTAHRRRGSFKLSARIVVVGLWTVLFGMFILFFTVQMISSLSSVSSIGTFGTQSGTGVDAILLDSMVMLYQGGFLTMGAGGVLMAFGSLFVIGVGR
ncbi:MAG: hypothetical protein U5J98_07990 [Halobacteriales archaeon]|nr:hypothetical protein [Halobacteriales archaeon]